MTAIKDQHKYILEDLGIFGRVSAFESLLSTKEKEIGETRSYLKTQTDLVCQNLVELKILQKIPDSPEYAFTSPLGLIAAQFAEVHPIPLALLVVSENWFQGYTAKEMVGVLSAFVDVRLPEHERAIEPQCANVRVKNATALLQSYYNEIRLMEIDEQCYTGIKYEDALCFDMADAMMDWCDLKEERECKVWLQELVAGNVSAGDFAKACMKLSATAKELIAMCEVLVPTVGSLAVELAHTLSQIDALILKHIATTQSLYL